MQAVISEPKVTTRVRPTAQQCEQPRQEIISTMAAICPTCGVETRLGMNDDGASVYGGCAHFREIHRVDATVLVLFDGGWR